MINAPSLISQMFENIETVAQNAIQPGFGRG